MSEYSVFWTVFWIVIGLVALGITFSIVSYEYIETDYKTCVKQCDYMEDTFISECIHTCNEIALNNTSCGGENER